ncbi:MAG: peptidoglycan editing factor PgeF [Alphaproteobacteria bacterium]
MLAPHTHPLLDHLPYIRHGFFSRHGGVSKGIYESLNGGGRHDKKEHILENRQRVKDFFVARKLLSLAQCHSSSVIMVDNKTTDNHIAADGMVCREKNLALCILTADCAPLLLADKQQNIIAACHAGWRGATGGVIEETIRVMQKIGGQAKNMIAVLGPTIGPESYEVREDMVKVAIEKNPLAKNFFREKKYINQQDKLFLFDLPNFCMALLQQQGVDSVAWLGVDTLYDDNFFSHRRNRLAGKDEYGRLMNVIMLAAA